ncbi:PEP-CTERM putative exosortase interaction domain-containing protein [Opitutaceae bacterium TAV1]|nr:PEP-CTERM putative exosortase interaction domain-containing protein [Opitutaceae bacterium TAV1]
MKNSTHTLGRVLLAAVSFALASTVASAAGIDLASTADTYVRSDNYNTNFGSASELWIGQLAPTPQSPTPVPFRTLLAFDLSAIPANAVINSVSLTLQQVVEDGSSTIGSITVNLYLADPFTESTATWNNTQSGAPGSTVLSSSAVSLRPSRGSGSYGLPASVTWSSSAAFVDAVQTAYNAGTSISFLLADADESDTVRQLLKFASRENTALVPKLTIDYTVTPIPEPATVAMLLGAGMFGVAVALRCRRA